MLVFHRLSREQSGLAQLDLKIHSKWKEGKEFTAHRMPIIICLLSWEIVLLIMFFDKATGHCLVCHSLFSLQSSSNQLETPIMCYRVITKLLSTFWMDVFLPQPFATTAPNQRRPIHLQTPTCSLVLNLPFITLTGVACGYWLGVDYFPIHKLSYQIRYWSKMFGISNEWCQMACFYRSEHKLHITRRGLSERLCKWENVFTL